MGCPSIVGVVVMINLSILENFKSDLCAKLQNSSKLHQVWRNTAFLNRFFLS